MDDMGIYHITSSPHYHQSNGLAEKYVSLVRGLLYKAKGSGKDPYFAWMLNRKTPLGHDLSSPIELICARQSRSDLPMSHASRVQVKQAATKQPVTRPQSEIIRSTSKNQAQATSNLLPIHTNYDVQDTPSKLWYLAVMKNILQDTWKYSTTTPDGAIYRCSTFHLKSYRPYKLSTNQRTQISAQTPATNCIQEHVKQASAQTGQCLRQSYSNIRTLSIWVYSVTWCYSWWSTTVSMPSYSYAEPPIISSKLAKML